MSGVELVGTAVPGDVDRYRDVQAPLGAFDELLEGSAGSLGGLGAAIDSLGHRGLLSVRDEARRLVDDDGIQYGFPTPEEDPEARRPWNLDPLPLVVAATEWAALERGIQQRAHLLGLILDDLYSDRLLLRRGVIPAEVVLGHPGFVRQADGIRGPGTRLTIGAHDLGRDSAGAWRVLADRTSAPSGAGYAMANRRIVSQVMAQLHRDTDLVRLRGFFHTMRAAIMDAAPGRAESPRAVLLSPGAYSETAYDQSFLASLLGFPLVESDDLALRDGQVWMRSGGRLARVDAIIRRVDPDFCDPLELRADSQLGLPGLIEATRRGAVSVLNSFGAGVLENAGLAPYLARACRELLGEDLLLENAPTWWCGDRAARAYVVAHLDRLIIRRLDAVDGQAAQDGWALSGTAQVSLRSAIESEPWAWVAQEPLPLSTAPVVDGDRLTPGRVVLRTFWVAGETGATVMKGGLGRIGLDPMSRRISSSAGAIAKDVWVLSGGEETRWVDRADQLPILVGLREPSAVPPRVADNLFWIGRYLARAEVTTRLLRVVDDLSEDYGSRPGTPGASTMQAMIEAAADLTRVRFDADADPHAHVRAMLADTAFSGSVAHSVRRMVDASQNVRDLLSYDVWHVLSRLVRTVAQAPKDSQQLRPTLLRVIESLLAMSGIVAESMVRDESWGYLDGGMRLERGLMTAELLRSTLGVAHPPVVEGQVTEAVLEVGESIITHRRRTVAGVGPAWPVHSAVALLLADPGNPRSVAFQVARLHEDFVLVGDADLAERTKVLADEIGAFDIVAACADGRAGLASGLQSYADELRGIAQQLERRTFARRQMQRTLSAPWTGGRKLP